ncbi:TOPRIM nucleotidyl transferase/hydrolase domain-containing protein [Microbacterium sp. CFBP9034]|uniref:TOPRIM nucleotidyl transferase/hydrolase domain-containing protein n=1 Tax=Microbacterium sp. CFBP9034 TaxID=3096540 RepID=UPI002A6B8C6A|nr:TOPRIM nucleotidyl transferase/hydrolase domain-containing protein [Microbacterium sp. CFBP9034]MDY0910758.1 TOPRIM nucleotidyl transferase/hydrolase domain-containing protein [Microbacterium sp. CFBP9034]
MHERRRELARKALEGYPEGPAAALVGRTAPEGLDDQRAIVLVEGVSDQIALEAVARRLGRDLPASRVAVVPTGGAHGTARMLRTLTARPPHAVLSGVYDVAETDVVRSALLGVGLIEPGGPLEEAGFFACEDDLEDELIRALGPEAVERCLTEQGDIASFRTLQKQVEWRERDVRAQLRRWCPAAHDGSSATPACSSRRLPSSGCPGPSSRRSRAAMRPRRQA